MIFAFETKPTMALLRFVRDTNNRLSKHNIVKNPFEGRIYLIPKVRGEEHLTYVVDMEPVYPKVWIFGLIMLAFAVALTGQINSWAIFPLLIFSAGVFWTRYFYILMLTLGVRKAGHKDKLKIITSMEIMRKLFHSIL